MTDTRGLEGRLVIAGCGWVGSLGEDASDAYRRLRGGETGLREAPPFADREPAPRDVDLDSLRSPFPSAEIMDFDPATDLGDGNLRPLDRTGRLAAVGCARALRDAGWSVDSDHRCGLVLGTQYGGLRTIAEFDRRGMAAGPLYVKPFEFANSVINAAAGQAAIWHALEGPNTTVSAGAASGVQALGYAADLLRSGAVHRVLAGGAEELSLESWLAYSTAGQLASETRIEVGTGRGTVLGEGAGFVALERLDEPLGRETAPPRGEILGYGEAFDPSRGVDPTEAADSLVRAVRAALDDAGLAPSSIGLVAAAANGMATVDGAEQAAWDVLWSSGPTPEILETKPALGECLGASGGHQLILLLEALRESADDGGLGIGLVSGVSPDGHRGALLVRHWD